MVDTKSEPVNEETSGEITWPQEAPIWRVDTAYGTVQAKSTLAVLRDVEQSVRQGKLGLLEPIPTGFDLLDHRLGGGLRLGELVLVGGVQGVGKTMMTLQMARNIAVSGNATCLFVCFEHDEISLLQRLISQETIDPTAETYQSGLRMRDIQGRLLEAHKRSGTGLMEALSTDPRGDRALRRLAGYADRLLLMKASDARTTVEALGALVAKHKPEEGRLVLFIDYLQRVPAFPEPAEEAEKVTRVVQALKGMALAQEIAVVAIVAADKEGLKARRLRLHHFRGSSALTYEADVVLVLNEKYRIVSKTHIEFNVHKAQTYHDWLVCTIEKNRSGRDNVDIEFEKRFEYCCLDPRGGDVTETLIEERIYTE